MTQEQKIIKYGSGQVLFRQDEEGGTLFFIQKGNVELTFRDNSTGEKAVIAKVGENSVLGIMSILEGEVRSATATALTDVECIIVNQAHCERLMEQIPKWLKVLIKDLSGNLRTLNTKYTALENRAKLLENQIKALKQKSEANKNGVDS